MNKRNNNRRWTIVGVAVLGLLGLVPITAAFAPNTAEAAIAEPGDGTTSATAGASCWGIKQQYPATGDGSYWLSTALLDRPAEFQCDMTTAGGGWVLVARGRNGWSFNPSGQGSPASITNDPDGPAAFDPAALGTDDITGLLNGGEVNALPDGVRLERSLTADGSSRQDYRLYLQGRAWTWNFEAGQLLDHTVIDGATYQGSNTLDTRGSVRGQTVNGLNNVNDQRRLYTSKMSNKGNQQGFGIGSSVGGGSNSATNHLWTSGSEGSPLPFTRVWIRPQIANDAAGFTPIPANGFEAETKRLDLKNRSEIAPWGVEGYNHDDEDYTGPWRINVAVVKVYGDRVYVGGRFRTVKQGPNGAEFDQQSLAAFDLDGNWISTFRPQIDGRVWDMTMTDDGKLIIGGDFTSVDDQPDTQGLAALDPTNGNVNTSWIGNIDRTTGGNPIIRSLDSRGDEVYAAGRFNRFKGGASDEIPVTNAISMRAENGGPRTWNPRVYAAALSIRVSNAGDRVYMAGYFNSVDGDRNHGYYAITNPTDGSPEPGIGPFQGPIGAGTHIYQQAVGEAGDNILVGGSQHDLQMYDHNRDTLIESHITRNGGDFQAIETFDGYVYGSCHCMNWTYSGTNSWTNMNDFRSVDPIRMVGRWDAETLEYDTSWYPNGTKGINDAGVWSIDQDSRQCLWVGGDLLRGSYSGNAARDYLGGFARFCPGDTTAPSAPTALDASVEGGAIDLTWAASSDDSGSIRYDVYRNDRVIGTTYGTAYSDTEVEAAAGSYTYTVRAADPRGNRSASPAPIAVNGPAPELGTPIEFGSTWTYSDTGTDLGADWRTGPTDGWASGPAPLGWNGSYATEVGPDHPTTTYFRHDFDVADPSQVALLDIGATFTQGAVVYVNGIEVGRTNMPTGPITYETVANQWVGGSENLRVKPYAVPASLLQPGTNTVAVEVHGWRKNSGKVFFDLQATLRGSSADGKAPSAPELTATPGAGQVDLSWTPSTDDEALGGYLVERDGAPLAVVAPTTTAHVDGNVDTSTPTNYRVVAFDQAGNQTASAEAAIGVVADPTVMGFGSDWAWWYQADAPAAGWQDPTYDTAGWQVGAGELGFGDGVAATVISTDPGPRPLTAYFRSTVDIADPSSYPTYGLDLVANAGAVIYVNGVEVARDNMRDGPVDHGTYAPSAPWSANRHKSARYEIPASAFIAGTNTIAVEVHNNWRTQPTMGFDLAVVGLTP